MFDVTGGDVALLNDTDLRTLVARLATAELSARGAAQSAVTAGGNQDAADGGIDVRVALGAPPPRPDFIPRAETGFQVKKPAMARGDILKEMRPGGVLRPVIAALADAGGAYVIVSAQGSVADAPLQGRRAAMREALAGYLAADALLIDFYDRERLAAWINVYPGVAAWVRMRIGGAVSGWRPIGVWRDTSVVSDAGYIAGGESCLLDERSRDGRTVTLLEGIREVHDLLAKPGQCVRLIGMSGLGKTRLVEALFEPGVAGEPLDPALSVYADYGHGGTIPPAAEMARRLVEVGDRAILIVDNCNPATHAALAAICSVENSPLSLLTVEYDVRDDEPEGTEVFRLLGGDAVSVEAWLERGFGHVSQIDRSRIAAVSGGNFRIARAIAETVHRGENLGQLRDADLFARIFQQRNVADSQFLGDAQLLSLLYSFDGTDVDTGSELAQLGALGGRSAEQLYAATAELQARGIGQSRGKWRAVLPQAVANVLAAHALRRIAPGRLDAFVAATSARTLRSLSRRLGYLHDSADACAAVARWLPRNGPLGDIFALQDFGFQILRNLAPVAPAAVLAAIEERLAQESAVGDPKAAQRWQLINLLKALAYDPDLFNRAGSLLARLIALEPADHNQNSARGAFGELFQLYLSGTRAIPAQRRALALTLLNSSDVGLARAGRLALAAMLTTHHFTALSSFDFGARPRDYGWRPTNAAEEAAWYVDTIRALVDESNRIGGMPELLASKLRGLWYFTACREAIAAAADHFAGRGGWTDGWIALRTSHRFDGKAMSDPVRSQLETLVERLKPVDLPARARAFVLSRNAGGYDITDADGEGSATGAWERAAQAAVDIGAAMVADRAATCAFLGEVVSHRGHGRTFEFGRGLALGAKSLAETWADCVAAYSGVSGERRDLSCVGGFLYEANRRDPVFGERTLDAIAVDNALGRFLPYFQSRVALDSVGLERLRTAVNLGHMTAHAFNSLASGVISDAPPAALVALLDCIAALADGVGVALEILDMRIDDNAQPDAVDPRLLDVGRRLLRQADFSDLQVMRDYHMGRLVEVCLSGPDAFEDARAVCLRLRHAFEKRYVPAHDASHLLTALFKVQPEAALDGLLLDRHLDKNGHRIGFECYGAAPIEAMSPERLIDWANKDPGSRFPLLGQAVGIFISGPGGEDMALSPLFLALLAHAPDPRAVLGNGYDRLHPTSWGGSLAELLERRKSLLMELGRGADPTVNAWVAEQDLALDGWIAQARSWVTQREETFE